MLWVVSQHVTERTVDSSIVRTLDGDDGVISNRTPLCTINIPYRADVTVTLATVLYLARHTFLGGRVDATKLPVTLSEEDVHDPRSKLWGKDPSVVTLALSGHK